MLATRSALPGSSVIAFSVAPTKARHVRPADRAADLHGEAQPDIGALDRHQNGQRHERWLVRHWHRRDPFPGIRRPRKSMR
jgi:hypothetical protein